MPALSLVERAKRCVIGNGKKFPSDNLDGDMAAACRWDCYRRATMLEPLAARVFERMPAEGVRRNVTTYNAVLTSLGRQRRLRDMESLRREMRAMNIEANETTFSVLITAHGNAGDCHRACVLLDEACDTPWVYKSAVVFNSALGACVKAGEQALGKRVLRLMRSEGIHPTLVTYNTMLMGASAERDWEEVATVFRELLRSGQVPDAITLDCLCGIEKLQAAADARADAEAAARRAVGDSDDENDAVLENGVVQTPPVSHAAVSTDLGDLCERLREVVAEETERAANPARDAQARADGNLMGGGSSAASRRGTYPGAPPPTRPGAALTYAYDALLRALHVSGRGEEVERAFAEMTDGGARRTVHTYNSLIASHEARRQWQRAGDAMARMQEEGIAPDAITFDALIDVAEETGQWDRATAWLEQAQEEGHLRWDSLGEYLALAVSLEGHAERTGDATAKTLAETLNEATGMLLDNNKSPSRKGKELDNRGSTFYIAKYWAEAMAKRDPAFAPLAKELADKEEQIVSELIECQGPPVDLGGYWKPDFDKCTKAMRASPTFNKALDSL